MPKISYRGGLYEGTLKDGVPHGKGILKWESGDEYRGQWKDGEMTGFGIRYAGNGKGGYFSRIQGYARESLFRSLPVNREHFHDAPGGTDQVL